MSTFCAATTLLIAADKVLAFALNAPSSLTLTLYDWAWKPIPVPFCDTGLTMTYLGLDSSHHLGDVSAHVTVLNIIRAGTTALRARIASSACKLDVIRMQLFPKILYPAAKACWSLREHQLLDSTLSGFIIKTTSHLMHSTATDTLFFPASHGGTGAHKLSDLAQIHKWNELNRAFNQSGEAALAAHGLLERALRQLEYIAPSSQLCYYSAEQFHYLICYSGSLFEWGHTVGCAPAISPSTIYAPADAAICNYPLSASAATC